MASHDVFHRPEYAQDMARQLLQPSSLQLQVRSGVFLSGIRRIGKTTFLRQDLIPTLEAVGGAGDLRRPLGRPQQEHGLPSP